MSNKKIKLFKLGLSEHKRTDLIFSYISAAEAVHSFNNMNWKKDKTEIQNILTDKGFFKNKETINIKREKNLLCKYLKIMNLNKNKNITLTSNANISSFSKTYKQSDFFNFTWQEYWFLQTLLKFNSSNKVDLALILSISINKTSNSYNDYLIPNIEFAKSELLKAVINKNIERIKSEINFKSGIKKNDTNYDFLSNLIKKIIDKFIEEVIVNNNKFYSEKILSMLSTYLSYKKLPDGLLELFFGELKGNKKTKIKKHLKDKNYQLINHYIPENGNQIVENILNRKIVGSYGSYKNLIFNHLNSLPGIDIDKITGNIVFKEDYKNLYYSIIKNVDNVENLSSSNFIYPEKLLEILNINNSIVLNNDHEFFEIWNKYFNQNEVRKILELNWTDVKETNRYISKHHYLKGRMPSYVIYEYAIGLAIFNYDNKEELKNRTLKDPWNKIKEYFGLNINSQLLPTGHAPGGKADVIRNLSDNIELYEPTIQVYRQTGHELEGIKSHLIKIPNATISYLVAPKINPDFISAIKGINQDRLKPINKEISHLTTQKFIEKFINE